MLVHNMENIVIAVIATVYMDKSLTYSVIWVVMVMEDNSVVHTTLTQCTSSNQQVCLCDAESLILMVVAVKQPSAEYTAIFTVCIVEHRPPPPTSLCSDNT